MLKTNAIKVIDHKKKLKRGLVRDQVHFGDTKRLVLKQKHFIHDAYAKESGLIRAKCIYF